MYNLIEQFPAHLQYGLEQYKNAGSRLSDRKYTNVLVSGMGGSGVAGLFLKTIADLHFSIPVIVVNGYHMPAWVDNSTLVINSSYSGNTEETICGYHEARAKKATTVVITSGGRLKKLSEEDGNSLVITLPDGYKSPRACFAFSFFALLAAVKEAGLVKGSLLNNDLDNMVRFIMKESDNIRIKGEALSPYLVDKKILIYSSAIFEPAAIRFRQQINENSKSLGWVSIFPEMNHNELVGWHQNYNDIVALMLRSPLDHERIDLRMNITKEIIAHFAHFAEVRSRGDNYLAQLFYFVHMLDWCSYYLAKAKGVDPVSIVAIDFLKHQLDNH